MKQLPDKYPSWTFTFSVGSVLEIENVAGQAVIYEKVLYLIKAVKGSRVLYATDEDGDTAVEKVERCIKRWGRK